MSEVTTEQLKATIATLEFNEANFTSDGKPDATVLSDILNTRVSAKQRDAVWAEMKKTAATPPSDVPEPDLEIAHIEPAGRSPLLDAEQTAGLYKNVTKRNVFTMAGRVGAGELVDLGDEDPAGYKGRLERV